MKKNAEEISRLIYKAILMCNDFSLNTAKFYLQKSLLEINKVHAKREKRESNWKAEQEEKLKKMKDKKTNPNKLDESI